MNNSIPIKERLIELSTVLSMSMRAFSVSVGRHPSWLQGISKDVGSEALATIVVKYPQVNIRWLLLGEGEIFIQDKADDSNKDSIYTYLEKKISELEKKNEEHIHRIGALEERLKERDSTGKTNKKSSQSLSLSIDKEECKDK